MSDLVERLRFLHYFSDDLMAARSEADADLIDQYRAERKVAANEIERLRFELKAAKAEIQIADEQIERLLVRVQQVKP